MKRWEMQQTSSCFLEESETMALTLRKWGLWKWSFEWKFDDPFGLNWGKWIVLKGFWEVGMVWLLQRKWEEAMDNWKSVSVEALKLLVHTMRKMK
jgi:hypothetical protein